MALICKCGMGSALVSLRVWQDEAVPALGDGGGCFRVTAGYGGTL